MFSNSCLLKLRDLVNKNGHLVDLVIPTKDEEKYIGKTLMMLSRQTWYMKGLVRIVIANYNPYDDPDPTDTISKEFNNVEVLNVHKQGIGHARNVGILSGDCPFIISFDADSFYDRNDAIEKMIIPLIQDYDIADNNPNKARMTVCNVRFDDDYKKPSEDNKGDYTKLLLDSLNFITGVINIHMPFAMGSSMAFTRPTFEKINGFRELPNVVGEDVDFALRVCVNFSINAKKPVNDVVVIASSRRHSKLIKNPRLFVDYTQSVRE